MANDSKLWMRLSLEGLAIVVSILLAFAIDAAWERHVALEEEREILLGLRTEFEDAGAELAEWAEMNRTKASLVDRALADPDQMSDAAVDSLISSLPYVNVIDRGGGPVDALFSSGRLELIQDLPLREALARWPDRTEDLHTNDLSIRSFVWETMLPFMAGFGVPDGRCVSPDIYCVHASGLPESYRTLLTNDEFRALLTFQMIALPIVAGDMEEAQATTHDFVARIDAHLGR